MKIKKKIVIILLIPIVLLSLMVIIPHYIIPFEPQIPTKLNSNSLSQNEDIALKVYPILSGYVETTYGQFYQGLEGWVGIQSVFKILTDSGEESFWIPEYIYLIEHPKEGLILFDGGVDNKQSLEGYYQGLTSFTHETNYAPKALSVRDQITSLGFAPNEVKHLIISHLHEDHVGGIESFPNAVIHISKVEWEDKDRVFLGFPGLGLKGTYKESFNEVKNWNVYSYESGVFYSFNQSHDLFGDGSIILLPTPGHTLGHTSAFISHKSSSIILPGDAIYTMDHMDPESMASFQLGNNSYPVYKDSINRLVDLQKSLKSCVILPSHEFSNYNDIVEKSLVDGSLTNLEINDLLKNQKTRYMDGKLIEVPSFEYVKSISFKRSIETH